MPKRNHSKEQAPPKDAPDKSINKYEEKTGSDYLTLQRQLMGQLMDAHTWHDGVGGKDAGFNTETLLTMFQDIKPRDGIEGLLAAQMVATHNAAMDCLRRAANGQSLKDREQNLKFAAKLLSISTRQIETLNKHRGKGQQKMTVEHVHVESGGQAVVGHIEGSGRP